MVVELQTFRLAAGVDEDAFLAHDARMQAWVSAPPGVARRTTARGADGQWLCLLLWWDEAAMRRADDAAAGAPAARAFTADLDAGSLRRQTFTTLDG